MSVEEGASWAGGGVSSGARQQPTNFLLGGWEARHPPPNWAAVFSLGELAAAAENQKILKKQVRKGGSRTAFATSWSRGEFLLARGVEEGRRGGLPSFCPAPPSREGVSSRAAPSRDLLRPSWKPFLSPVLLLPSLSFLSLFALFLPSSVHLILPLSSFGLSSIP